MSNRQQKTRRIKSFGMKNGDQIELWDRGHFIGDVRLTVSNGHKKLAFLMPRGITLRRTEKPRTAQR